MKGGIKYIVTIFLALLFFCTSSACSDYSELNIIENSGDISVILKADGGDYWKTVKMGARAAAKELGANLDFSAPENEDDLEGQLKLIKEAADTKPDALVLAPCDCDEPERLIIEANKADVPVIVIDSELDSKSVPDVVATNNYDAGMKAGEKLLDLAGPDCRIAVMSFDQGRGNAGLREKGLFDLIALHSGIDVAALEYCPSGAGASEEKAGRIISGNRGLDAIIALNSETSIGAANAIEKMGLSGKVKVVAFDCTQEEIEFLEDGVIQATVIQNPFSMGYLGIKYAVDAINHKKVPGYTDTGSKVIDRNNMYLPENQKLIFPFDFGNNN